MEVQPGVERHDTHECKDEAPRIGPNELVAQFGRLSVFYVVFDEAGRLRAAIHCGS